MARPGWHGGHEARQEADLTWPYLCWFLFILLHFLPFNLHTTQPPSSYFLTFLCLPSSPTFSFLFLLQPLIFLLPLPASILVLLTTFSFSPLVCSGPFPFLPVCLCLLLLLSSSPHPLAFPLSPQSPPPPPPCGLTWAGDRGGPAPPPSWTTSAASECGKDPCSVLRSFAQLFLCFIPSSLATTLSCFFFFHYFPSFS